MTRAALVATCVAACAASVGCGAAAATSARRTVGGVAPGQVVEGARRVLEDEGFEVTVADVAAGQVQTDWRERGWEARRCEVAVSPGEAAAADAVVVAVTVTTRERAVSGWGPERPLPNIADRLADEILEEAQDLPTFLPAAPVEQPAPQCRFSTECPPGLHCAGGRCLAECATNEECAEREQCDGRGRCVPIPPAPEPCPEPAPAPETR
ncbi:MAG: hypothetical protein JXB32_17070 [Deltaproteobacteria bacterium]|nr:hypothetical protein [Deltaproteobacteria bacterium]